jgi:hypothetical protein
VTCDSQELVPQGAQCVLVLLSPMQLLHSEQVPGGGAVKGGRLAHNAPSTSHAPALYQRKRCTPRRAAVATAASLAEGQFTAPDDAALPPHTPAPVNNEPNGEGPGSGKLQPKDYPKFVQFFRHASPYIAGHRGRTFVIVVPGNVSVCVHSAVGHLIVLACSAEVCDTCSTHQRAGCLQSYSG